MAAKTEFSKWYQSVDKYQSQVSICSAAWEAATALAVEKFTSTNTSSPKLPEFKECIKDICSGQVGLREQHIYRRGAEWMYNFIVGKIGLR